MQLAVLLGFSSDPQMNRERVIQTVDGAVQGGEGRSLVPGLHHLPVRPVTQNGKHVTTVVATATSLPNASGVYFYTLAQTRTTEHEA